MLSCQNRFFVFFYLLRISGHIQAIRPGNDLAVWELPRASGQKCLLLLNPEPAGSINSYWMSTVVLDPDRGLEKFELIERLAERGIDSRPIFSPLSSLKAYADSPDTARAREVNVNAYRLGPYGINLPSALKLTEADVEQVCEALKSALAS